MSAAVHYSRVNDHGGADLYGALIGIYSRVNNQRCGPEPWPKSGGQ